MVRSDGAHSRRWIKQFEQMYPSSLYRGPAYAVLGDTIMRIFAGTKLKSSLRIPTEHAMDNATTLVPA